MAAAGVVPTRENRADSIAERHILGVIGKGAVVLLLAAKSWRYEPAVKDGKPVKFKKVLAMSVNPQNPTSR